MGTNVVGNDLLDPFRKIETQRRAPQARRHRTGRCMAHSRTEGERGVAQFLDSGFDDQGVVDDHLAHEVDLHADVDKSQVIRLQPFPRDARALDHVPARHVELGIVLDGVHVALVVTIPGRHHRTVRLDPSAHVERITVPGPARQSPEPGRYLWRDPGYPPCRTRECRAVPGIMH